MNGFKFGIPFFVAAVLFSSLPASSQTLAPITVNGDPTNRVDLFYIGDGYTASELNDEYVEQTDATNSFFFENSAPFTRYKSFFNSWRVNIASNESGADDPVNDTFVDTALDATYNSFGTDRCLYFNTNKADNATNTALLLYGGSIDVDIRLGIVNSSKYGGCGGKWAVWSGANSSATDIAVHETAHSFSQLADEYFIDGTFYSGIEFRAVNVTNDPNSGRWDRWVGYDDPDTNIGVIDYYEGARYNEFGAWRPSNNSLMRSLNRPFDAVSREKIISDIYEEVDPLDAWSDEDETYSNSDTLWVEPVDSDVIAVRWYLDSALVQDGGETLDLETLDLPVGNYEVTALAYDTLLDHSYSGDSLDWWRLDAETLQQSVTFNVDVIILGDVNLDGVTNFLDISPFVALLARGGYQNEADTDGSGRVNVLDIAPFVAILGGQEL